MRVLGVIGLLAAVAIILVAMVLVGKGVTGAGSETPTVKTGTDKAYDEMKKDGDIDDPKDVMRGALKGDL